MKISAVLPVYNCEKYIQQAIDSILNQTFKDFELIIINDGSTDGSLELIKGYNDPRIVIIDQNNQGLAKTLNNGLAIARGEYIARMDADDISMPDRFEKQLAYLTKYPKIKLLGTGVDLIDKDGESICIDVPYTGSSFLKKFLKKIGNPFKHPSVMFDRELALYLGGYNEKIGKYFEDYFLWSEFAHHSEIDILNEVLLKYRITPGSIMSSIKSEKFSLFMLKVINNRTFTDNDAEEMKLIKKHENAASDIENKDLLYQKRIGFAKNNKMNRVFIFILGITNIKFAMKTIGFIKKMRIYPKL